MPLAELSFFWHARTGGFLFLFFVVFLVFFLRNSVIPESLGFFSVSDRELSVFERDVLLFVLENWPCSSLEVAEHFGEKPVSRPDRKRVSTRFSYHLQKLVGKRVLFSKRFGNSLVVWPVRVEKYRTIHSILQGDNVNEF